MGTCNTRLRFISKLVEQSWIMFIIISMPFCFNKKFYFSQKYVFPFNIHTYEKNFSPKKNILCCYFYFCLSNDKKAIMRNTFITSSFDEVFDEFTYLGFFIYVLYFLWNKICFFQISFGKKNEVCFTFLNLNLKILKKKLSKQSEIRWFWKYMSVKNNKFMKKHYNCFI
jgi:hypothetical protein